MNAEDELKAALEEVKALQTEIAHIAQQAAHLVAALVAVHPAHPDPQSCVACKVLGRK